MLFFKKYLAKPCAKWYKYVGVSPTKNELTNYCSYLTRDGLCSKYSGRNVVAYEVYIGFEEDDWNAVWRDGEPTEKTLKPSRRGREKCILCRHGFFIYRKRGK